MTSVLVGVALAALAIAGPAALTEAAHRARRAWRRHRNRMHVRTLQGRRHA